MNEGRRERQRDAGENGVRQQKWEGTSFREGKGRERRRI